MGEGIRAGSRLRLPLSPEHTMNLVLEALGFGNSVLLFITRLPEVLIDSIHSKGGGTGSEVERALGLLCTRYPQLCFCPAVTHGFFPSPRAKEFQPCFKPQTLGQFVGQTL